MKKSFCRVIAILITLITIVSLSVTVNADDDESITVLFTHDLHSHLLPSRSEDGGEFGGYARLMTVINEQRKKYPDAILVDGGDFSMGSLFQTAFATSAIELRMMGAMGYDATTFGNHEFDYLPNGLISMLNAAKASGEYTPPIVDANYLPSTDKSGEIADMWDALNNYGVKDYIIVERGGVHFVIFGIMGFDSDECAPNSGMILEDPSDKARETVDTAVAECEKLYGTHPVVVCLSHSGTEDGKGEDYEMAEAVDGIDIIISGHTHTTLEEAIEVNGTYIVSAGEYGKNLGVVNLSRDADGNVKLSDYELISIDESIEEDDHIAVLVQEFKNNVETDYLSKYGVGFDEVLVNNDIEFDSVKEVYASQHESTLANVFADAYKTAVEKATGEEVDVALTAAGVIRESIPMGDVTTSDVFNAASLGVGTEGELIAVYITGRDLMNALEVDASVQPLMNSAQLFFSGVEYSFNTYRMIFNKVDYAMLRRNDGSLENIESDKLYRIVTGMYCGQMLGAVESTSMGLISITPRDENGNAIAVDDLVNYVVKDENGVPVKEWYAIASYLKEMGGKLDARYGETDGRKVVYSSLNPIKLLRNANKFTFILLAVIVVLITVIVLVTVAIVRKVKRKKLRAASGN
ncbi:MAG: bifunctional metallophosphatase/5'-nucleotidase [Clostridia bacterium]|nr:bifunctional metallophosphatase/5'-nucleotidase [Clostridia bacterium]